MKQELERSISMPDEEKKVLRIPFSPHALSIKEKKIRKYIHTSINMVKKKYNQCGKSNTEKKTFAICFLIDHKN